MEDEFGASLFNRHSGGVILTHAGKKFVRHARQALSEVSHAAADVGPIGRGEEGVVRIGIFLSLASGFLVHADAFVPVLPAEAPGMTVAEAKATLLPNLSEDLFPGGDKAGWWLKAVTCPEFSRHFRPPFFAAVRSRLTAADDSCRRTSH